MRGLIQKAALLAATCLGTTLPAFAIGTFTFLAAAAHAQTPTDISVANDLKACIRDTQGVRDITRSAQLEVSMRHIPNRRWSLVNEIAPGVFRITGGNQGTTLEIKLRAQDGTAHCLAFGPSLTPGQGALAADKFVEFRFMEGLTPAAPRPGHQRRYVAAGAPYTAELIAYTIPNVGDVVGFSFSGVPAGLTTRALSRGDPSVTFESVAGSLSNAVEVCLRNYISRETVEQASIAGGFELAQADGRNPNLKTYFSQDNAVSIRRGPGTCMIETLYLNPSMSVQITNAALNRTFPGGFIARTGNNGCTTLSAGPSVNLPLSLNIYNVRQTGGATCNEDGTSRVTFVVAG